MGESTNIGWCHHTFNGWWGCEKISPACKHCYAATLDARLGGEHWGPSSPRRFFDDRHWAQPHKWNKAAKAAGERRRVFCGSMKDVMEDRAELRPHRVRLWQTIRETPWLDWLLLTKRPGGFAEFLPWMWKGSPWGPTPYPNVWLGVTAEDQEHLERRVPTMLAVDAVCYFVSYEPALGPLDARKFLVSRFGRKVDWMIAGCESGRGPKDTRGYDMEWFRSVRDQCAEAGAAFFLKQATEVADVRPSGAVIPISSVGKGSTVTRKRNGTEPVVEAPYLDGKQHLEFPTARAA